MPMSDDYKLLLVMEGEEESKRERGGKREGG